MIRRDTTSPDGQAAWLLITQIQHARLAGQLAEAWRFQDVPLPCQTDLLWTVSHHDDGWQLWEERPGLDDQGTPIDFLEMTVAQVNPLWARSIDQARLRSPLAEHLVAWHFLTLRTASSSADQPDAKPFAEVYQPRREIALRQARAQLGSVLDAAMVERLRQYLQFFDLLSLTLCCGPLFQPVEFQSPGAEKLICRPQSEWQLTFDPWPWSGPASLHLEMDVRQVPARSYRDAQDLKQASRSRRLHWVVTGD